MKGDVPPKKAKTPTNIDRASARGQSTSLCFAPYTSNMTNPCVKIRNRLIVARLKKGHGKIVINKGSKNWPPPLPNMENTNAIPKSPGKMIIN